MSEDGKSQLRTTPWPVAVSVKFPFLTIGITFAVAVVCSYLSLGFFNLDNPLVGLRIRDDIAAERADAWYMSLDELRPDSGDANNQRVTEQTAEANTLMILYVAEEGSDNVFTVANVAKMAALEDKLISVSGYKDHCLFDVDSGDCAVLLSPLRYVRNAKTDEEMRAALQAMWLDRDAEKDGTLVHFPLEFDNVTNVKCRMTRTSLRLGLPLPGYLNVDDRSDEQRDAVLEWMLDGGKDGQPSSFDLLKAARDKFQEDPSEMVVTFYQSAVFDAEVLVILGNDIVYAGGSLAAVLLVMLLHLGSPFLALVALFQVLLSFPVCFFIYRVVFGIELFGGLNIISLYLLLGIGADDVFIMSDAFFQSRRFLRGPGWSLERRLAWAFHRAAYTMASTTITTGFAFLMLATSIIPVVRYFGIFTALLLFVNFFLVCAMYLPALVIWGRYFGEGTRWIPRSDAAALAESPQELPGLEDDIGEAAGSKTETFFRDVVARKVINNKKGRLTILAVFGAVIVAAIALAAQLELAEKALSFWEDDHFFGIALNNLFDSFKKSDTNSESIKMVWGLQDPMIDRADTKETRDFDFGKPIFMSADGFDLADERAQLYLRDVCYKAVEENSERLFLSTKLDDGEVGQCFMAAFALWREARNESFPVPRAAPPSAAAVTIDNITVPAGSIAETFEDSLVEFLGRPNFGFDYYASVGLERGADKRLRVKFAVQEFVANISEDDPFGKRSDVLEAWDAFAAQVNAEQPDSLGEAFYTDFIYFVWQRTQFLFVVNAVSSIVLSLVLVMAVATVATRNWRVALLLSITILLVVVVVVAGIVLYGFKLGSIESVLLVLVIGVGIDFSLHIAVGYSDAQFDRGIQGREERVEHALTTLGTSILAGAFTTLLSTVFLLFTTIIFFSKFGRIMVVAVVTAFAFAALFFPALLSVFGPEGRAGNVCVPQYLKREMEGAVSASDGESADEEGEDAAKQKRVLGAGMDSSLSDSIKARSPASVRKAALLYVLFMVLVVAASVVSWVVRSGQVDDEKAKEEAEDANVVEYDDTVNMPAWDSLEQGKWVEMRPGGETLCARGTPYAFFIRKGAPGSPMIFELEGGGACWNDRTCQRASQTFKDTVEDTRAAFRRVIEGSDRAAGLQDENGPYAAFTHVFVPYCSADLHWGNSTVQYTENLRIRHRGAINAGSAFEYLKAEIPRPPRVLVTGCSAGAYGSLVWGAHLSNLYEGTSTAVVQMADAGLGVISSDFLADSFPAWQVLEAGAFPFFVVPDDWPTVPLDAAELTLPLLYRWAATRFPNTTWSQFSSAYDWNQAFFLKAQKLGEGSTVKSEDKVAWNTAMNDLYDQYMPGNLTNLLHLIGPGDYHCNIGVDSHWYVDAGNGSPFYSVLHKMFVQGINPGSIDCRALGDGYCEQGVDLRATISKY